MDEDDIVVKDIGDDVEKFIKGNVPVDTVFTKEQLKSIFKKKRVLPVVIEIRTEAPVEMTRLEDRFNLLIEEGREEDNVKVLQNKMKYFSDNIRALVQIWEKEMKSLK